MAELDFEEGVNAFVKAETFSAVSGAHGSGAGGSGVAVALPDAGGMAEMPGELFGVAVVRPAVVDGLSVGEQEAVSVGTGGWGWVQSDAEAAFVDEGVVGSAEQDEVVEVGGTAL